MWVVHIETGETVGFLRFEAGVQEIFAVQVLPGIRFPECWNGMMRGWPTPMCCPMPPWRRWCGRRRRTWRAPRPCTSSAARPCISAGQLAEAIAA